MRDAEQMAQHTLEYVDPGFAQKSSTFDIIVAGENFGTGSSREEAVNVFKILGIKAILARSFARIYYRNLINVGIPAIELKWEKGQVSPGDRLIIHLDEGKVINKTQGIGMSFKQLPDFITSLLEAGGILEKLKRELKD